MHRIDIREQRMLVMRESRDLQCSCSLSERESGHRVECNKPQLSAALVQLESMLLAPAVPTESPYLDAESVLANVSNMYAEQYRSTTGSMNAGDMAAHTKDREALLRVRSILVDLAESGSDG